MPTNKPRYTITVNPELQQQIEDYQFSNRIKSQTKAIIALMELGLQKIQSDLSLSPSETHSPDEEKLVEDYRAFNEEGKEKVRDYVADLSDNPKYKKSPESSMAQEA